MPNDAVAKPIDAYHDMASRWELIDALLGGTIAMRAGGTKWLPKEPAETPAQYDLRLSRSILYEAYADTVHRLVSKPFCKPVSIKEEARIPDRLIPIADDVDQTGRSLTDFARCAFERGLNYGLCHALVDYPKATGTETLEDERQRGLRPRFIEVSPANLIGWQFKKDDNGAPVLDSIRIREVSDEPSGEFGSNRVERIRYYSRTEWRIYEKGENGDYVQKAEGVHTLGVVPLVTFYTSQCGMLMGKPPLEKLAWLNLAHYQSMSDQRNILRFSRSATLFASGFASDELPALVVGPNQFWKSTNENAKVVYVEHSGKAIETGVADLRALEERMEVLGLAPLTERSGRSTATGKILEEGRTESTIQAWIRSLEGFLIQCYKLAALWIKTELGDDFKIDVFSDFGIVDHRSGAEVDALLRMRQTIPPQISHKTFLQEIRRRGLLSEAINPDMEIEAIASEPPIVLGLGATDDNQDDADDDDAGEGDADQGQAA